MALIVAEMNQPHLPQTWRKPSYWQWPWRRRVIRQLARFLPYKTVYLLLVRLVTNQTMRDRLFAGKVKKIKEFFNYFQPHYDETLVSATLLNNLLFHFDIAPKNLSLWSDNCGEKLATLLEQHQGGPGVILLRSHEVSAKYFHALPHNSYRVGQIFNHTSGFNRNHKHSTLERMLFAHSVYAAKKVLTDSGAVNISADGPLGYTNTLEIDFHGRRRKFYTTFAELALLTGASVYIVTTIRRNLQANPFDSRVQIELLDPLDPGSPAMPDQQRIRNLLEQYVAVLAESWAESPWEIKLGQMAMYLRLPVTDVTDLAP